MQVRKYEASTIKEAVEMVKSDLGPDAIILSTRESVKNLGNKAGKKVMITAAVSEQTYQMKKLVDENLSSRQREKLQAQPVREQRDFINHVYGNLKTNIEEKRRKIEARNYASIPDEDFYEEPVAPVRKPAPQVPKRASFQRAAPVPAVADSPSNIAKKRVKAAAEEAFKANTFTEKPKTVVRSADPAYMTPKIEAAQKIDELKTEIKRLQNILKGVEGFKKAEAAVIPMGTHAGAKLGVSNLLAPMYEKLTAEGFEEKIIAEVLKNAENQLKENVAKKSLVEAWVAKWIFTSTEIVKDPFQGKYHFFVGPRGAGKTSTLVKMASHLVIKEKKRIAIVTTDTNKVGATEQLRIYSQILNVPFAVWNQGQDLNTILAHMQNVDFVLFDTEGRSLLKMEEIDSLKAMIPANLGAVRVHLVLSAMLKDEELYSTARRFKSMNYNDVVFTNIDQLRRHGMLANFQQHVRSPYFAFSMGPMIPEDFEWASKERVLDLIFKISKSKSEGE